MRSALPSMLLFVASSVFAADSSYVCSKWVRELKDISFLPREFQTVYPLQRGRSFILRQDNDDLSISNEYDQKIRLRRISIVSKDIPTTYVYSGVESRYGSTLYYAVSFYPGRLHEISGGEVNVTSMSSTPQGIYTSNCMRER